MEGHLDEELVALAHHQEGPCLSVFMSLGQRGLETPGNEMLGHLLTIGAQQLQASGQRQEQIDMLLAPALELANDRLFWSRSRHGIALFIAPDLFRIYQLPYNIATLVVSGMRFHLTPLFPMRYLSEPFYILALSKQQVRLLYATDSSVMQLELPKAPKSLAESLQYDEFEAQHQLHSGIPGNAGERGPIFHGQGATSDVAKDEILRYCQQIDHAVERVLQKQPAPLVLAGVSYLLALYRSTTTCKSIVDDCLTGSPDQATDKQLYDHAWALVLSLRNQQQQATSEHYCTLAAQIPSRVTSHLRTIVPAATNGHVEALFVANNCHQWGTYDPTSYTLVLHAVEQIGDADLFDIAAVQTLLHKGNVFLVAADHMPTADPCVAILRP